MHQQFLKTHTFYMFKTEILHYVSYIQVREKDDRFQQRKLDGFFKKGPAAEATSADLEVSLAFQKCLLSSYTG